MRTNGVGQHTPWVQRTFSLTKAQDVIWMAGMGMTRAEIAFTTEVSMRELTAFLERNLIETVG